MYKPALTPMVSIGVAKASANSAVGLRMLTLVIPLTGKPFLGLNTLVNFLLLILAYFSALTDVAKARLLISKSAKGWFSWLMSASATVQGCQVWL